MAAITLVQAQAQLELYLAAEAAVLTGQSYEINGRKLTRAQLADIQKGIAIWTGRVNFLIVPAYVGRARVIVPAD